MDGIFTIQLEGDKCANYKLYSLNGTLIQNGVVNSQKEINVESPRSGVYMLDVSSDSDRKILKVIIK